MSDEVVQLHEHLALLVDEMRELQGQVNESAQANRYPDVDARGYAIALTNLETSLLWLDAAVA